MAEQSQVTGAIGGAGKGAAAGAMVGGVPGAIVGGILGGIGGFLGGGGEKAAMELAKAQAEMADMETRENMRRQRFEMGQVVGRASGLVGASNLQMTGSSERYIGDLESQYLSDISWTKRQSNYEVAAIMKGGRAAADSIKRAGQASAIKGIGAAATAGIGAFGSAKPVGGTVGGGPVGSLYSPGGATASYSNSGYGGFGVIR